MKLHLLEQNLGLNSRIGHCGLFCVYIVFSELCCAPVASSAVGSQNHPCCNDGHCAAICLCLVLHNVSDGTCTHSLTLSLSLSLSPSRTHTRADMNKNVREMFPRKRLLSFACQNTVWRKARNLHTIATTPIAKNSKKLRWSLLTK